MKKKLFSLLLSLFLLTNCTLEENASPPTTPIQTATEIKENIFLPISQNPVEIRYAILAPSTAENIWSLFDEKGASYENYATQGKNHPHLYHLAPPNNELTPLLAEGFPSPFTREGEYFVSTLSLRPNLKWDDGTPLTAEDVAFTINTALAFRLGLNWAVFYNPEKLHHAEALNSQTVKYYFSTPPNAGDWQYGALIGVFTSQKYWASKIEKAQSLLPLIEENPVITAYQNELNTLQHEEKELRYTLEKLKKENNYSGGQKLRLAENTARQRELENELDRLQKETRMQFTAARTALFSIAPAEKTLSENHPVYPRDAALQALLDNKIDFILSSQTLNNLEIEELSTDPNIHFAENRRNDIRFLAFNHHQNLWDDVSLRRALSCLIDPEFIAKNILEERVVPALGWVAVENTSWHTSVISPPCAGLDADARLAAGTRILQKAGYVWSQEPSPNHAGSGLLLPSGEEFPAIRLLAPREDSSRTKSAFYIEDAMRKLGIPLKVEVLSADDLFYAVYGIGDYDLAIIGWNLSLYPDYLCDFFGSESVYGYENALVNEKCADFSTLSDLALAREKLFEIEVLLWDDLPAVPLFSTKVIEAYRNFALPTGDYLGGFAPVLYGVPK